MTPKQFVIEFNRLGSIQAVSRLSGMTYRKARTAYLAAVKDGLIEKQTIGRKGNDSTKKTIAQGNVRAMHTYTFETPAKGMVNRYILTCAQNNTKLHEQFWRNLLKFAEHLGADIHVARFLYNKGGWEAMDKAQVKGEKLAPEDITWDAKLAPYFSDERAEIAPGLVWCGELNILPTAARPLSGLEVYTGRRSGVFPHVKIAMDSIASARGEPAKFNYTTGTVTLRNYIQRKAGQKAEFHHCYGALLVEVDSDGDWFCRQINADSEGTFYDLDTKVQRGRVTHSHRPMGIVWGDIHVAEGDRGIYALAWGKGGMLDALRPRHQFLHDVLHFRGRSHHELKNPHTMFKRFVRGEDDVAKEMRLTKNWLLTAYRSWCKSVIPDANHHHHLGRWLQEQEGQRDPVNAEFWIAMQKRCYALIRKGETPNYLLEGLREVDVSKWDRLFTFLAEDESFVICPDEHGGIECGQHGDLGPNGSRGSALNLAKIGRRANIGHTHSCRIVDGIYQAGTCGSLHPDWSRGPSPWSHSHIITYENGKRTIVTMWNNKWRAA